MCVPSIAPMTPGKYDRSSIAAEISAARSTSGHFMNVDALLNNAFVTRLIARTAVARPTSNRSQIDLLMC